MAPEVALIIERERREHRRDGQLLVVNEYRRHGSLPPDQMNGIGQVETGDFCHAFGKENEPRRVVLVIASISSIETSAVEILLALDEAQLDSLGTGGLPDFARKVFRANWHREPCLRAFRPERLVFPDAAEEGKNDGHLMTCGAEMARKALNKIRKPAGI